MIFALLTFLAALALAAVAGWFSIVGFMAIYAGAPMYALIMGVVMESAKLVTTSWIYRNWDVSNWKLKIPLIYFTAALMIATSIGVFGLLSKAHLEQGASTIDNSAKIETLNYQIQREKLTIADNEKVIAQLDATVNSFLGKDRIDKSLAVRKSQAAQRQQLREDSAEAQKRIDKISDEKFKLESEVRKVQLDVGPIRYIAELFYGAEENATKNIESAVRIFTLLIVSTLDPLAVILLIAANHTWLYKRNEEKKEKKFIPEEEQLDPFSGGSYTAKNDQEAIKTNSYGKQYTNQDESFEGENKFESDSEISFPKLQEFTELKKDEPEKPLIVNNITNSLLNNDISTESLDDIEETLPVKDEPNRYNNIDEWSRQNPVLRELLGSNFHFIPKKVIEKEKIQNTQGKITKYPQVMSWISEFKRS